MDAVIGVPDNGPEAQRELLWQPLCARALDHVSFTESGVDLNREQAGLPAYFQSNLGLT